MHRQGAPDFQFNSQVAGDGSRRALVQCVCSANGVNTLYIAVAVFVERIAFLPLLVHFNAIYSRT